MARRGENIYKRKDGRWEGRYKSGIKADGTAKYSSIYGKTYAEVKAALSEKRVKTAVSAVPKNLTDRFSIQVQHIYEKNFLSTSKGVR